jgi:hypothetical protein
VSLPPRTAAAGTSWSIGSRARRAGAASCARLVRGQRRATAEGFEQNQRPPHFDGKVDRVLQGEIPANPPAGNHPVENELAVLIRRKPVDGADTRAKHGQFLGS